MKKRTVLIAAILGGGFILTMCARVQKPQINTGSLFAEMTDLAALTRFPDPGFKTVQFSSFDRRSSVPGGPDWFANSDGFGGEPIPNFESVLKAPGADGIGEYLMADVEGPGALVRLWTASIAGQVRLYIDDMERPLHSGEADPFFRRPYDIFPEMASIDAARFRATVYQRDASYAPLPFAKRFRLVWIGKIDEIHFYHIQVRCYEPESVVVSFRPNDIRKYRSAIDKTTAALANPDASPTPNPAQSVRSFSAVLPIGGKEEVLKLAGPGAVERLTLRLKAGFLDPALRQTVLHIFCDDQPQAQVQSPVGDFFGAAPGVNPYRSLPFTVRPDGAMTCRFVMPYRKSLRIVLENRGGQEVRAEGEALSAEYLWDERSMHFRARWRVNHELLASGEEVQDLPFLLARGQGLYVGTTSILLNPATVPTPWGNWWGEGDEKVFVDDDRVPSIFGTGSEDFYNYSWSSPDIFEYPYCGQPRNDGPGNRGFVTNFRWHILDPIPFKKSIGFFMELNSHEPTPGLSYARIGYYYARPGTIDDHAALMPEDLRELKLPESWQPAARFGARDSVFYAAEDVLANKRGTSLEEGRLWAGSKLLVWKPEKKGDSLAFRIPVDAGGLTRIHLTAALTPRSGRMTVRLDGRPLEPEEGSGTIDLRSPYRTMLRDYSMKPLDLAKGVHTLVVEYAGSDPNVERPEIGIDFVWVQKASR